MRAAVTLAIRARDDGVGPVGTDEQLWQRWSWQGTDTDETLEFGPRHECAAGNFCYLQVTIGTDFPYFGILVFNVLFIRVAERC